MMHRAFSKSAKWSGIRTETPVCSNKSLYGMQVTDRRGEQSMMPAQQNGKGALINERRDKSSSHPQDHARSNSTREGGVERQQLSH
eukprot:143305-Pleurochrysis_carterae.AAC.2